MSVGGGLKSDEKPEQKHVEGSVDETRILEALSKEHCTIHHVSDDGCYYIKSTKDDPTSPRNWPNWKRYALVILASTLNNIVRPSPQSCLSWSCPSEFSRTLARATVVRAIADRNRPGHHRRIRVLYWRSWHHERVWGFGGGWHCRTHHFHSALRVQEPASIPLTSYAARIRSRTDAHRPAVRVLRPSTRLSRLLVHLCHLSATPGPRNQHRDHSHLSLHLWIRRIDPARQYGRCGP